MNKIYNEIFDETYYKEKLDNGLEVIIFHKPDYMQTTACFGTPYGSLNINQKFNEEEKSFSPGIAHFLEHKLFEAEGKDILNRFSELGANVNAFTSYRETVYYFSKIGEDIEDSLNLLLDFVQDLDITDESVEKEKGIICEELSMYLQNPDAQLINESLKSIYKDYPLMYDIGGDADTVNGITKKELEDCYSINYHPSNMYLVIVSPVDPEKIITIVRNNQNSKSFVTQVKPISNNKEEIDGVVRKEHSLNMDVANSKASYIIKMKPNFNNALDAHIKEVMTNLYLTCYFSNMNPQFEKWMNDGIINDYFGYEVNFTIEAANIIFYAENIEPAKLKELVDEELKKDLVNFEKIEQIKRRLLGNSFKVFNEIEGFAIGYIRDILNGIDYFDEIDNLMKIDINKIKDYFSSLNLSNYSLINILKK